MAPSPPCPDTGDIVLKQLARTTLKPVAAAFDTARPPAAGITILIYHRVGADSGGQVDLGVAMFDDQMAELAAAGNVISLDQAVELLASGATLDHDSVVITFDDGTPDVVDFALPVLERHALPMTLYLATSFIEDGLGFWDPLDQPLSWTAAQEAVSTGLVTIGSHTHTHALLDRLAPAEIADERDRSIDLIGSRLEVQARHFAYPKALLPSPQADAEVRARFDSAAIAGTRPNSYGETDVHLLTRSPVQRSDGMRWFRRKAAGGMGLEDRVRDIVNTRRYAHATK